jgi:hypothetical protein
VYVSPVQKLVDVPDKEVVVFEESQHSRVGNDAQHKEHLSSPAPCLFNENSRRVIHDNGKEQDEDINRDKCAIEDAAGNEQVDPAKAVWQQKEKQDNNGKEKQELKRIEQHRVFTRRGKLT